MASNWRLLVAAMASLMAMACASSGLTASMASLEQNGYTNIVVAVDDKVPEDDCQVLLQNLKNGFKEASRILLPALQFKAYFKTVKIVLPETWRREECLKDAVGFATRPLVTGADFKVAQPNPVHGDDPYTIQPHGCGKRGLYTHLTPGFLKNTEEATKGTIARALVQEWAKLRYGVYEEYGYPGDSMYPHFYTTYHGNWTKEMRPTGCSNQPVLGTRNCSGNSCVFYPSVSDNSNVTSSLMYLRNLPNATHFCNSQTHVKEAPTKHNVLCHGKDVESIISSNEDFRDVFEVTAPVGDTDFEVLRSSNRRIVFALDRSNATSEQNVWSALGPRLYTLIHVLNQTNPDIELGIVEFDGDRSETKSRGGMRTPAGFLDRSPPITTYEYLTDSPAGCIDCGLSEAWKLLRARSQRVDGMEIVVLTRQLKPVNLDKLVAQFRNAGIILHAIVVEEGQSTKYDDVERAAIATNGRVFRIKYGDSFVRTGANIAEAFEALFPSVKRTRVYEKFLDPKTSPNSSIMTGNFTLETEGRSTAIAPYLKAGSDLDVFLFFYQTLVALDVPRQFVAEGKVGGFRQIGYKPVGEFPMFLAHFGSDATRDGEYQYKFSPGLKREEYLIEAHGHYDKTAESGNGLSFVVWTSWDHLTEADLQDPLVVETTPLKLYAKVEKDGKPVFDARVWAVVTIKREHEEDFSDTRTLIDDGRGDPDIQRGDGVYSAYFTNFVTATSTSEYRFVFACDDNGGHARFPSENQRKSAFEYGFEYFKQAGEAADDSTTTGAPVALSERQVAARSLPADEPRRVEDYWDANAAPRPLGGSAVSSRTGTSSCCGSEPVDLMLEPSGAFSSFTNGKLETITFQVPATSGSLIFPPSRVMDLRVDVYDGPGVFRLTWSAPGDEYTVGTVSQYVIAYGENWDSVAYYKDGVKTFIAPMTPQTYGSAESLDVNATDLNLQPGVVYFFSVRGCDQASKCGTPSNVILASLSPMPDPELGGSSSAPGLSGLPSNKLGGLSAAETFGIAVGCVGFLILAAGGWCVYLVYCRRRKDDPSAAKAALARKGVGSASSGSISNNNGIRHSTPSGFSVGDDDPKGNGEISTISNGQVGSPSYVPASQLLGAHEKQMGATNGDIYGTTTGYQREESVYGNNKDATMESGIVDDPHMGYMADQPQQDPYAVSGAMPEYNYDPSYYYGGENQGYEAGDMAYGQGYPGYENTYGQQPTWYQQQHLQQQVQQGSGRSSRHSDSTTTNSIPSNSRYEAGYDQHYNGYDGPAVATEQLYARPNKMPPSANTSYDHLQMAGSRHSSVSHQTPPASGTTPRVRNITQV